MPPNYGKPKDYSTSKFINRPLAGSDLRHAILVSTLFYGCDLRGASLREAKVDGATFQDCDLRDADLRFEHHPSGVMLSAFLNCDLRRATLIGIGVLASVSQCDMRGADLRNTNWVQTLNPKNKGIHIYGNDMRGANLAGADFFGASFPECDLRGVRGLETSRLEGCNLSHTKLDRESAVLAALKGARVDESEPPPPV